jgi:hypothetical protein
MTQRTSGGRANQLKNAARVLIISSAAVTGSRVIPSEEVDRAFGMPVGKLRSRAGIATVAHVVKGENELTLAASAAQEALRAASCGAQEPDWILATSEHITITHRSRRNFIPDWWCAKIAERWTSVARALACSMRSPSRDR